MSQSHGGHPPDSLLRILGDAAITVIEVVLVAVCMVCFGIALIIALAACAIGDRSER